MTIFPRDRREKMLVSTPVLRQPEPLRTLIILDFRSPSVIARSVSMSRAKIQFDLSFGVCSSSVGKIAVMIFPVTTGGLSFSLHATVLSGREKTHTWLGFVACRYVGGFSWHGVVVRLDAMLFDVSLPPITILHLSAPSARLVLRVRVG